MPWKGHGSWISLFQSPEKNQYGQLRGREKVNE